jgi:hypothetical protein
LKKSEEELASQKLFYENALEERFKQMEEYETKAEESKSKLNKAEARIIELEE